MSKESSKPKKPKGFRAFDALARKLVRVPKSEVERRGAKAKEDEAK